ncbi:DeoR/GlpR family DNA-binding transcription regulator [Paenibacillus piri]|uniref:DeoR/GlpR transcriptional regulator n=1 Tax=Paenibacillus piri TaxID=2547395 RepID=A0A4V2ZT26_9BACL|nr:DeoR/GlpR family DNA-binding transcription regulator [Paenibacillus piri]TDF95474.1 DeoR/GlpR transcriptional regulator [Paenibacillus piri]
MLAVERKMRMVEFVRQNRTATIAALAKEFHVHEATIRRDLTEIEQNGLLKRTHGGVVMMEQCNLDEPPFMERSTQHLDQKMRIGKMAASLVQDGESIIIDSGTTTLHIARNLINRTNITVVTNDMNVAAELRDAPRIQVILTGGELSGYFLNGMFTDHALRSLHVDKAFISPNALHPQHGLMHPEAWVVPAKQAMIQAAREMIVVADSSKIGKLSLHLMAPISSIHALVTGKEASEYDLKPFQDNGITVYSV